LLTIYNFLELEHEFTQSIGKTYCISTKPNNRIIYGIRKGRIGHSRFILDQEPQDCNSITCVLKKIENYYLIITIYIGRKAGREPWDEYAQPSDLEFWENHALIYNLQDIIEGSELSICPWVLNKPSISRLKIINK
jgi:hypothetical protein